MAQLERWNGLLVSPSVLVPVGMQVLWKDHQPVICVPIGAPIEDAECDHIMFNPADFERLKGAVK